ncbi:hypothetical protein FGG08_000651 [Glutinoglossum americanum]|uniref:Cytochrome P450 n=1 Tax=Glutinoglossum americanum TaxID=1670608 RepID=A0A9P8IG23_9PEZI|nr:hypothetical protein FGG08_000651 [Glutinoglossum americanum]
MGQWKRLFNEPPGVPMTDWMQTIPNDGIIRYLDIFNSEAILPTSEAALAEVLTMKSEEFVKPRAIAKAVKSFFGAGLTFLEGREHKIQRKALMPAFSFRRIKDLYPSFWSKSCEFVDIITAEVLADPETVNVAGKSGALSSPVVDISSWLSRATLDILGVVGLGHSFGAMSNAKSSLLMAYSKIFMPSAQTQILIALNLFFPRWVVRNIPFKRNRELYDAAAVIRETCRAIIKEKRAVMEETKSTDVDILSAIQSSGADDDGLVEQLVSILAAGHETPATAVFWAVCLLAQHPEMQSRLRADIRTHLPSPKISQDAGAPTPPTQIDRIPYLQAVCNETLRFCPPFPLGWREVAGHRTTLLSQPLPKGTRVMVVPWAVNRDPARWGPDAGVFNPDRWMGPGRAGSGGASSNFAFMTFFHGPRGCVGENFARAEMACLLAVLVGRFEMELEHPERELAAKRGLTSRPMGVGVRMRLVDGW